MNTKILSSNGYKIKKKECSTDLLKEIKTELTVNPFTYGDFGEKTEKRFSLYMESPNSLYLPRFYGQDKLGLPSKNKINEGTPITIKFNGSLRKEQEPIVKLYHDAAIQNGGGLISLKCGGGKTVLALYIISLLKVKTIVVVHKDFLMTQWRDRIKQFLPEARIGKIQQNTVDIENKDIVLAMVQSLSMKEYDEDTFSSFGLAVFDECHHLGAEVFHKSMPKVASKYMLGLSATPNRKDGLRKVFEWYIGPLLYTTTEKNTDYIETRIYEYYNENEKYSKNEILYNGKQCLPRMINNICEFKDRCNFINQILKEQYDLGRKILILSDRRGYLDETKKWANKKIKENCAGLYVGGMKPNELRDSQEKDIILGTFSMASEGMDIPKLNTIILSSPKSDVVQSVGRILREKADVRKFHPLVIDIKDTHPNLSIFNKQCDKRIKYYKKSNYDIYLYKTDGSKEKIEKRKSKKDKNIENIILEECLLD
jgi:superfamily II DNA or RNA helicase